MNTKTDLNSEEARAFLYGTHNEKEEIKGHIGNTPGFYEEQMKRHLESKKRHEEYLKRQGK